MTLSDISIKNPVFAWMIMAFLIVFGGISFQRMGISQMPNADIPTVSINARYPGASAEVMDIEVAEVIERSVSTIQGITTIRSSSRSASANVTIEFDIKKDIDVAVQEIQNALVGQGSTSLRLPREMDPVTIQKSNTDSENLLFITVRSEKLSKRDLMVLIRDSIIDQFATIPGVGAATSNGYEEPNARIWLEPGLLAKYELTPLDVVAAVQSGHVEVPSGEFDNSNRVTGLRTMGEFSTPEQLSEVVIQRRGGAPNYKPVKLKAVATVEDGLENPLRRFWADGVPSVAIGIQKQPGANQVEVARAIRERVKKVNETLPEGTTLRIRSDTSVFIEESMKELYFSLFLAALLTAFVCLLFLGSWTATLNVVLAIPTSIIGAFIIMNAFGFTLNFFTMLALTLAIGIVVDDSIMVLENIVRYRELGLTRVSAAKVGAKEITLAATAATFAVIAIYLPVAFMEGIIGLYLFQFGVTLSLAVLLSLVEALTLTPMRCAQFLTVGKRKTFFGRGVDGGFALLARGYKKAVGFVVRFRILVVVAGIALFVGSLQFFTLLKQEFIPPQDQDRLFVRFNTPVGSSLDFTTKKFQEVDALLKKRPEIMGTFGSAGGFGGGSTPNGGFVGVTLKPRAARPINPKTGKPYSQQELIPIIREDLKAANIQRLSVDDPSLNSIGGGRSQPIQFSMRGPDYDKLIAYVRQMMEQMRDSKVMVDVDTSYQEGLTEIHLKPDRDKAELYGVTISEIAQTVQALMSGLVIGQITVGSHRNDIRIQVPTEKRLSPDSLKEVNVRNSHGEMIPLMKLVTIQEIASPFAILREDRTRAITVSANIAPGFAQSNGIAKVNELAAKVLPPGYHVVFSGSAQNFLNSFQALLFALILGIAVSYMVLASQFNSFIHPFTVLIALPFSASGALIALYFTGQTLNIYSMIALLLLMGIVKKNSIMLVDFTNRKRKEGLSVKEALREACPVRLRPILMTSVATIAAALPPALAAGPGAESRIPMAIAVIGGVTVSTVMTLFVVPSVYSLLSHLERKKYVSEQ